ncbi:fluoride efflux transporter CrcB [Bacillus methanolicus]|uniref:fluoride efflux transporter CrcB n=1 Tax=Bacillus methanolicus TaxID=1471 RepID=UPI00237FE550|nr:fluoride efflux transporter CrcB [Bacillus methanolicus]MDE3838933.1 fluoride efflux transporter CrcB [Bacillus methanolicus]
MSYVTVGLGGIIGSLLRYFLSVAALSLWGKGFPIGTLLANLLGAFALGWLTKNMYVARKLPPYIVSGIGTGIIGSFTTFSTFSLETIQLVEQNSMFLALIYVIASFIGGLFFAWLGSFIAQKATYTEIESL